MDKVAVRFGLKELPNRLHSHCARTAFLFDPFDLFLELNSPTIAGRQQLSELAAQTQVSTIQHLWVDVAPYLVQIFDLDYVAVLIWRFGNWNIKRYFGAAHVGLTD